MRLFVRLGFVLVLATALTGIALPDTDLALLVPFSSFAVGEQTFAPWQPVYLRDVKKRTAFSVVEEDGHRALRIDANASSGSLIHRLVAGTATQLRWHWKVPAHNPLTDARTRKGDDYPVRLYVMFDYDVAKLGFFDRTVLRIARRLYGREVPAAALCYVWDPKLVIDTRLPNAYTDRVRMIVVRSGASNLGQWVEQHRDIRRDFRAAFGEDAPAINAIAVAGDSDNSALATVAFVGDITLNDAPPKASETP